MKNSTNILHFYDPRFMVRFLSQALTDHPTDMKGQAYADEIHASGYAADPQETIELLEQLTAAA